MSAETPEGPPYADLRIDSSSPEALERSVVAAALALYPPWRAAPPASAAVSTVSGGITNQLYRVESPAGESVLVRRFGDRTDLIINRSQENLVVALLTRRGFGPAAYGCVANGRVEQFLPGRNMRPADMVNPRLVPLVGARLAEMHALELPLPREPELWRTLDGWVRTALAVRFDDDEAKQAACDALDLPALREDLRAYRALLESTGVEAATPVVFAHNDLLGGNVMMDREPADGEPAPVVTFIDYEYGAYGYRGFDIANHFCECCGFECEWDQYPGEALQRAWLGGYAGEGAADGAVDALRLEVRAWAPVPHLFWAFWCIVQARHSPIDFDFLAYCKDRVAGFRAMRADGEAAAREFAK